MGWSGEKLLPTNEWENTWLLDKNNNKRVSVLELFRFAEGMRKERDELKARVEANETVKRNLVSANDELLELNQQLRERVKELEETNHISERALHNPWSSWRPKP